METIRSKPLNTYASPVIHYTAGIIDWTMEELQRT